MKIELLVDGEIVLKVDSADHYVIERRLSIYKDESEFLTWMIEID